MNTKDFAVMCKKNSIYPQSESIKYMGLTLFPKRYVLWFDKGESKHSGVCVDESGRNELTIPLV